MIRSRRRLLRGTLLAALVLGGCRKPASPAAKKIVEKPQIDWVTIPGGTFLMGSETTGFAQPVHRVTVPSFQLAKTLVTNKQYKACVDAGVCAPNDDKGPAYRGPDQPVVGVDWKQARKFSEYVGGRLPSEAEWEYAARSAGKDRSYPWGEERPTCDKAVTEDCGEGHPAPVCSKPAGDTEQGLCDMAGNVWEWMEDTYHDSYRDGPSDGSAWVSQGPGRVLRGGSASNGAESARVSSRQGDGAENDRPNVGFRPARSVSAPEASAVAAAAPAAEPAEAQAEPGIAGIEWVAMPGGTFSMGGAQKPRSVTVPPFRMTKTLVTNKQYAACVAAQACTPRHDYGSDFSGGDQPVVGVTWAQADAFARFAGGRLPSEAQWEYAAKSGGKDMLWPWGDTADGLCERAVVDKCNPGHPAAVCSRAFGNTKQGLCDMAGDVWEWLQDTWHDSLDGAPTDGSAWEEPSRPDRAMRGGSWRSHETNAMPESRNSARSTHEDNSTGFRIAR